MKDVLRPLELRPRAAVGHMPFAGHRTCAEWGNERGNTDIEPKAVREREPAEAGA
jgi:hypothetical protein